MSPAGVFWCKGEDIRTRICDEPCVVARTCDAQSCNWGLLLRWRDSDGEKHQEVMPIPMLHGHSDEAAGVLGSDGLHVESGQGSKLREYLLAVKPEKLARSVSKCGWHGGVYLTPEGPIGEAEGELLLFQPAPGTASVSVKYGRGGKAEQWRETIAALAAGNSRLVLAIYCAFTGPLLYFAGEESGGIHLSGESSVGKTTALRVATSVWGDWDRYYRT